VAYSRSQRLPCHLFNNDSRRPYQRTTIPTQAKLQDRLDAQQQQQQQRIHGHQRSHAERFRSSAHAPGPPQLYYGASPCDSNERAPHRMHPPSQAALPQQLSHSKGKGAVVPSITREHRHHKMSGCGITSFGRVGCGALPWPILIGGRPKEDQFGSTTWRSESRSV
jgi:hypothetical protein